MPGRGPRYSVVIQVDCSTRDLFLANRITNISHGGVFIEAVLPLDAEVDLSFTLPDSNETIGTVGRVVWTYDMRKDSFRVVAGSGIRFVGMPAEKRLLLEQYLEKLTPIPSAYGGPATQSPPAEAS